MIANDFERIELSFLSFARKLNKKRQAQTVKRVEKVLPELIEAHTRGEKEEVKGILKGLQLPSSKEWRKGLHKLVLTSLESGILRAHLELLRLKELYLFNEDWTLKVIPEGYKYEVILPEEAREYIRKHAYEIGVITEETVLSRLRKELEKGLEQGYSPQEMTDRVKAVCGTWMGEVHAQTIARTETGKFYNAGRLTRWLDPEMEGFVEALQYDAILDTRTTEVCAHLDGKIIPITDQATIARYTPPNHFQCRSTWLPVTEFEEWKPTFDKGVSPEEGFQFTSPLPKLLSGKKEPLVQVKKGVDPRRLTDIDIIRTLGDDDFKIAIRNIEDQALKLSMVKERAEQMLIRENGLREVARDFSFKAIRGWNSRTLKSGFVLGGKEYTFYCDQGISEIVARFKERLEGVTSYNEAEKLVSEFQKEHGSTPSLVAFIATLKRALKDTRKGMTWNGLTPAKRSVGLKEAFKIKEPPKTANYKAATGLRQALADGQAWLNMYMDDKTAPLETGIKLRFEYNLRRAYATGARGTIHFGSYERNPGVIVHEVGHVIHWNSPEISQLIEEFFMQRTDNLKKPAALRFGEKVIPDDFFNSYIGRIYGWEAHNNKVLEGKGSKLRMYGQEVLSMGLQQMYEDPELFYATDKEHFLLTYAILRGLF